MEADYLAFEEPLPTSTGRSTSLNLKPVKRHRLFGRDSQAPEAGCAAERDIFQPFRMADRAGRPPSQTAALGEYLKHMVKDFRELHGDRPFGDDRAILTGFGQIGHEKVLHHRPEQRPRHKGKNRLQFRLSKP